MRADSVMRLVALAAAAIAGATIGHAATGFVAAPGRVVTVAHAVPGATAAARGGDGIVREVRVLEPASLSLLTDRRRHAPMGACGGEDGAPGRNALNGEELPPKAGRPLEAGDVVSVETPGGGGWGAPS